MSQVKLSWTAPTDNVEVAGYLVEQQGPREYEFCQVGTSYNDTGLAAGSTYSYRVRAINAARNASEYSDVASAAKG
ncbi:MAG TPA: fibronectin type III domain-containing protein [Terracidiphilus sp.]